MNMPRRLLSIAGVALYLAAPALVSAQDLPGTWRWTTSCKGNHGGSAHKFKLTQNLVIVDAPEDTVTATDGAGKTYLGRALVNADKPSRFSVTFVTDSISQDLASETVTIFLEGSIKDGTSTKLKGVSTYAHANGSESFAFQCKDKLARVAD